MRLLRRLFGLSDPTPSRAGDHFDPAAVTWTFVAASGPNPLELIPGVDPFEHMPWRAVTQGPSDGPRARVTVVDPLYGQEHVFDVYEIEAQGRRIRFAAGEFSNGVWGFYLPT